MKLTIGVISDTHMPYMAKALPRAVVDGLTRAKVDLIVHCGDMLDTSVVPEVEAIAPMEGVAGNNDDWDVVRRFGEKKILAYGDLRIGVVHGHGAVRRERTPDHAFAQFADEQVHAVLFGHSHIPLCEWRDGRLLFNPGSPTDKRRQPLFSYGILRVDGTTIDPQLYYFDSKAP